MGFNRTEPRPEAIRPLYGTFGKCIGRQSDPIKCKGLGQTVAGSDLTPNCLEPRARLFTWKYIGIKSIEIQG